MSSLPPFLIFFIGAAFVAATRGALRSAVLVAVPLIGGWNLLQHDAGVSITAALLGHELTLMRVDKLSLLFAYVFHLAALIGFVFALRARAIELVAAMLYVGSALGAVFAGDLITFFVFWEMLAVSSALIILADGSERSYGAAMRYLIIQIGAGVILMSGVLVHVHEGGSIAFDRIDLSGIGSWLILLAFGIKCGFPLLHNWITDSYPESSPTGAVFLSAFTTKVAVYALARGFAGTELLVYVGAVMTMFPIFYAVIENDLRRVLAYSMINQIGFMVCGVGIGTELAINGAVSHAFNDIIFKGLLFMSMGAVLLRTGKMNGSDLGGLYKSMPKTAGLCIVGACSISAFPLFSGFVSKSMVMVAALEQGHPWVWLALLFASAGVFHHAGIKIPFFAFFAHDSGIRCEEAPRHMLIAMAIAAALCIFNGVYPWVLYSLLPFPVDYEPYTAAHVVTQCQLLFFSALAFTVLKLVNLYPPEIPGINIDAEWLYRRIAPRIVAGLVAVGAPIDRRVRSAAVTGSRAVAAFLYRYHGPSGALARTLNSGAMVTTVVAVLALYLLILLLA